MTLPSSAYLDANFLLHARDRESPQYDSASTCLAELIRQGVVLNISPLVVDEIWWALFKQSYRLLTGHELAGQEYKHNKEIWRANWPVVRRITEEILASSRINVLESAAPVELVREAAALIDVNPLAPRDAFHLALVLRNEIPSLVTADSDFDNVQLPPGRRLTIVRF